MGISGTGIILRGLRAGEDDAEDDAEDEDEEAGERDAEDTGEDGEDGEDGVSFCVWWEGATGVSRVVGGGESVRWVVTRVGRLTGDERRAEPETFWTGVPLSTRGGCFWEECLDCLLAELVKRMEEDMSL